MSIEQWYAVSNIAVFVILGTFALFALAGIWYAISIARDKTTFAAHKLPLMITGLLLFVAVFTLVIMKGKMYPVAQCPNCGKGVTSQYCADCGWQNDSYFEETDMNK
jgi:hypothetical protein